MEKRIITMKTIYHTPTVTLVGPASTLIQVDIPGDPTDGCPGWRASGALQTALE